MRQAELFDIVRMALECSIYAAPLAPGLTPQELVEVGARLGYQQGEVLDAVSNAAPPGNYGEPRHPPRADSQLGLFFYREEPDYRSVPCVDFVISELRQVARTDGATNAMITRDVLVERAVHRGLQRDAVQIALSVLVISGRMVQTGEEIRFAYPHQQQPTASEQLAGGERPMPKPLRAKLYPIVRDVVSRRQDGRPVAAEPLDAFAEMLAPLGHAAFRLWWAQTVSELRRSESTLMPATVTVLAAAVVEGALTFLVRYARATGVGPFGSNEFDAPPNKWKIDDLVKSAAKGGDDAVLKESQRLRAVELVRARQRIHAGRMLVDHPGGPPDLRPEEARASRETAEIVVRAIIDWLALHPATDGLP